MFTRMRNSLSFGNTEPLSNRSSVHVEIKDEQQSKSSKSSPRLLLVVQSMDRKSFSERSESSESESELRLTIPAPIRSTNGEQRRRSWRAAVTEAKSKAWSVLKSSATFHGSVNNSSTTSGSVTTGPSTEEEYTTSHNKCHKKIYSTKKRHTLSMPNGLHEASNNNNEPTLLFNLSQRQRQSLRSTWFRIRGNGGLRFAERIFQSLFESAPYVKDIFYKAAFLSAFENSRTTSSNTEKTVVCKHQSITTCRDHAWIVLRLLDSLILDWNQESNESITVQLRRFGAQHAFLAKSAGMRADLWEMFGEAAVDIVRRYDCIRSNTDASRAWRILFASITDEVRAGYERELRKLCSSPINFKSSKSLDDQNL